MPAPPASGGGPPIGSGPGAAGGRGGGGRNVRPILLGVAAVVAVIAAVAFVLTLGGEDDPDATATGGETPADSTTAPPSSDPVEETTTTEAAPATPFVQIDSVEIEGGQYLVSFTVTGFEPSADQGSYHSHFYLDDVEAANAGANGNPPGDWDLTYDTGSYLTKYGPATLSERPAEQMCSLVADSAHNVAFPDDTTGNCVPLPTE